MLTCRCENYDFDNFRNGNADTYCENRGSDNVRIILGLGMLTSIAKLCFNSFRLRGITPGNAAS